MKGEWERGQRAGAAAWCGAKAWVWVVVCGGSAGGRTSRAAVSQHRPVGCEGMGARGRRRTQHQRPRETHPCMRCACGVCCVRDVRDVCCVRCACDVCCVLLRAARAVLAVRAALAGYRHENNTQIESSKAESGNWSAVKWRVELKCKDWQRPIGVVTETPTATFKLAHSILQSKNLEGAPPPWAPRRPPSHLAAPPSHRPALPPPHRPSAPPPRH